MGFFSFKNTPKPRRFNHIPIYWDPEKEKREEREASIEKELRGNTNDEYSPKITRGSFRKYSERLNIDEDTKTNRKLIVKLFVALFLLIILGICIFVNSEAIYSLYFDSSI